MSRSVPCPSCSHSLFLPALDMMPGGKDSVICKQCYCRYNLVSGELTHCQHEVIQQPKAGGSSKKATELRRYTLRLLRPGQPNPDQFEFGQPSDAATYQLVVGDQLLLVFLPERNQLLQIFNLSTNLQFKVKSPLADALYSAQVLALALGLVCTGYLWVNKIASFKVAVIGSTVLSMGFGYGVYKRLKPKEKDLTVRQQLGTVQNFLNVQHRVELGLNEAQNKLKSDQNLIDQFMALKECMAAEPQLYEEKCQVCERSLEIFEKKKQLLVQQESGYMKVLNMLKVERMTSQLADQLPDAIDEEILRLTAQLEKITEQVEALSLQISAPPSLS